MRFFWSFSRSLVEGGALLLGHLLLGVAEDRLDLLEALDRLADGGEVRESAAQPAVVHVEHAAAVGLLENGILRLALGADKQNAFSLGREVGR